MKEPEPNRGSACPDEARWPELLSGTASGEDAIAFLQHAGQCPRCGPRLQILTEAMGEPDPNDRQILDGLATSKPERQHEMARTLMQKTGPRLAVVRAPRRNWIRWQSVAATAAMAAGPLVTWQVMSNRPPVIQERIVERVVTAPLRVANTDIVDLYPLGERDRSGGNEPVAAKVPAGAKLVTFILNGIVAAESQARVLDPAGRELWSTSLRANSGVYTMVLGEEDLKNRPLTIECGSLKYRIP